MFKDGGEVDESGTAENREESIITNQILTCPCGNKTTGGLSESGLTCLARTPTRNLRH